MINLMLGRPGSGKSYEAVVYHIIPAIESGRKVSTNLPLNLAYIEAVYPGASKLIEIKKGRHIGDEYCHAFGHPSDFEDEWRDEQNRGPLYVIDECHKCYPRSGTKKELEEYFAEHRHTGADVLLITQSHSKVNRSIIEMVQVCYRVSNNRTLGSDKSYVRKVLDGVRGEVINETIRRYKKANYKLYQSHTKSTSSVNEAKVQDVKPLWKHWSFRGAVLFLIGGVVILYNAGLPFVAKAPEKQEPASKLVILPEPTQGEKTAQTVAPAPAGMPEEEPPPVMHPYYKVQLHIAGYIKGAERVLYTFRASQNGQPVFEMTTVDLLLSGYDVKPLAPCSVEISYGDEYKDYVTCDSARIAMGLPGARG